MGNEMKIIAALVFIALTTAGTASADTGTPATPTPVIGTGGNVSGSDQGNSCANRPPVRFTPAQGSNPYAWAEPDWPGFFVVTTPTPGISIAGCSR